MSTIGILGAGSVGRALGRTLLSAGVEARYGVRDPDTLEGLPGPTGSPGEVVAACSVLFLAVPAAAAVDALGSADDLGGKTVVDCTNPLRWSEGPVWSPPPQGSVAEALAEAYPGARIVKGFNHFGVEIQQDPNMPSGPADALFASDDPVAKQQVMDLARRMGFRALDAGPLRNAGLLEHLAVTWIHMATVGGLGREFAFRLEQR